MKPQTLIPLSEYVDKVREIPKMLSKYKLKFIYDFSDKLKLIPIQSYSDLTTLNIPLTERGMEDFNINI